MTRGWLLAFAIPATLVVTMGPARAQDDPPGCPPGEWFCDDSEGGAPPPAEADPDASRGDADWESSEQGDGEREGIDVRRPAPAPPMERSWSEGSGGRSSSPWSLALRAQGVLLDGKRRDAGLGGVGVSGRYSLGPAVTFDLGLDSILGTDYNGNDRSELSLSLSSLFFLNYHPVVRTYVLVGLNTASARVDVGGDVQTWGYFGGHTGLGLEVSLDPRIALTFDILGFMRGRTDSRAAREPEFTDGLGRVTNTSGGGLVRGGVTLRF
jgi:Outer membrane protein beta-barrel domain